MSRRSRGGAADVINFSIVKAKPSELLLCLNQPQLPPAAVFAKAHHYKLPSLLALDGTRLSPHSSLHSYLVSVWWMPLVLCIVVDVR